MVRDREGRVSAPAVVSVPGRSRKLMPQPRSRGWGRQTMSKSGAHHLDSAADIDHTYAAIRGVAGKRLMYRQPHSASL
jgi:hypothetical protein